MREPIVLFGAGSAVIVDVEESCRRMGRSVAAIVQNTAGTTWAQDPSLVVPLEELDGGLFEYDVLVPLFRPANRRTAVAQARQLGARRVASILDPTSILPARLGVGEGIYVNAGCVIGACSELGPFAFVNRGCSLGHHLCLGEFVSLGPGVVIAGQVTIGAGAMIGAGAVLLPKITVGADAVVAAGAVVRRDVPSGAMLRAVEQPA
jgi:acetyltransferase-like isoleucine patch superfamily enzyme